MNAMTKTLLGDLIKHTFSALLFLAVWVFWAVQAWRGWEKEQRDVSAIAIITKVEILHMVVTKDEPTVGDQENEYEFVANGKTYTGMIGSDLDEMKVGDTVQIEYPPDKPTASHVPDDFGYGPWIWLGLFGCLAFWMVFEELKEAWGVFRELRWWRNAEAEA